ncbi:MAG: dipeptidase [Draconibacterium sp.]|nr:dipeptidase [Draconibacterium sp.]
MKIKKILITISIVLGAAYFVATQTIPGMIETAKNSTKEFPPYNVSKKADSLYKSLEFIADLHCDALLWSRDLTKKSEVGHVDFPRMQEANIAFETFTIVTKSPVNQRFSNTSSEGPDNITRLSIAQGRPIQTWFSLFKRATYQAKKLHRYEKRYDNQFEIIKSAEDLSVFLERRKTDTKLISGLLGIEGAHCLEGDLENLDRLYDAGIRLVGPTHFFDNELGGSAHGLSGEGLTEFGKQVIDRMNELGMIIDLTHTSSKMIDDILEHTNSPVIVSHTGVFGTYESPRNLTDKQLQMIAKNGGLVGITFFKGAIPEVGVEGIVDAVKYVADFIGIEHVAIGSDYDGSIKAPFDITGFPLIVEEMLKQGFNENEIKAVMGENVKNFLLANL